MKKLLVSTALFLLVISCSEKPENKPLENNVVDNVESSSSISLKRSRGNGNLVLDIYSELLKNDKNLQELEQKIENINKETNIVISEYENIINKSDSYYNDAEQLTRSITDSLVKKEIERDIKFSSERYDLKTKKIKDLIVQINKNTSIIQDQHTIFKIRKTLPEIEKYQNAHPLKTDSLDNFINKQNQLLNELRNLK
ncbi:hypothetical protein ASG31_05050 [Chryseobacterium sp. Leaf404]|uniref:hypothetical protein n=1 Tax=unclassified Chryseobacterium TaxID=2593645 RepID=UPI0006F8F0F4|nr:MULTISPECIES: hypothetical protein [unclassified Chryseobacterium]KQT18104.1 hypothetical protein ASG31_05050 [Chryseobacterium sp. Leaf404]